MALLSILHPTVSTYSLPVNPELSNKPQQSGPFVITSRFFVCFLFSKWCWDSNPSLRLVQKALLLTKLVPLTVTPNLAADNFFEAEMSPLPNLLLILGIKKMNKFPKVTVFSQKNKSLDKPVIYGVDSS